MTCKCGAQFCYTCGATWRTCSCTETDEANRQAALRRRRGQQDNAREAEAAEIARIIAEVDEFVRRNARDSRQEEERRAEEQRREEAELTRLEEQRLREEEERRAELARLEQHLRQAIRSSVEESCADLQGAWNEVKQTQMQRLDSTHLEAERQHRQAHEAAMSQQVRENQTTFHTVEYDFENRKSAMRDRHTAELATFDKKQQDLQDDLFLEIQMHLRGEHDRAAREHRLQERFRKQREERRQDLLTKHSLETMTFQTNSTLETQGLRLANESRIADIEHKFRIEVQDLLAEVVADRAWFDFLSQRRQNMVATHCHLMLEALETDQEPVGLTEETAMTTGPLSPKVRHETKNPLPSASLSEGGAHEPVQEQWKETRSPSRSSSPTSVYSFDEFAATTERLSDKLESLPA